MRIVKAKPTTLKSPLAAADVTVVLKELVDSKGNQIPMSAFGAEGILVVKQGDVTEMLRFTNIAHDADTGAATLTIATNGRDISPIYPYSASATGEDFNTGAAAIISNDPYTLSRFASLDEVSTFTANPRSTSDPANADDLVRYSWALAHLTGGAITFDQQVLPGTAGETLALKDFVYFKTSDQRWWKTDADAAATSEDVMLGIALGAGSAGASVTNGVLLRGRLTGFAGLTAGAKYYLSGTTGAITTTPGTKSVFVGWALSSTDLLFSPREAHTLIGDVIAALAGTGGTPSASNKFLTQDGILCGTGDDGAVNFDGTNTFASFASKSGNTYTLTRHVFGTDVTIGAGVTVNTDGFIIFWTGTISGTGTIKGVTGNNGSNAPEATGAGGPGGAGGTSSGTGPLKTTAGADGGAGGLNSGGGGGGGVAQISPGSAGATGGTGGVNVPSGDTGGGVSPGGSASTSQLFRRLACLLLTCTDLTNTGTLTKVTSAGQAGGGGGGAGNGAGSCYGSGGGGGGASGGGVLLVGNIWAGSFTIESIGGNGGNGDAASSACSGGLGGGGGGAGGSGGFAIVVYQTKTWAGSYNLAGGTGGSGATGGSGGASNGGNGSNGNAGTSIEIQLKNLIR